MYRNKDYNHNKSSVRSTMCLNNNNKEEDVDLSVKGSKNNTIDTSNNMDTSKEDEQFGSDDDDIIALSCKQLSSYYAASGIVFLG
jgi:hypothetical protein